MSEIGVPVLAEFIEARGITVASIVEKIREMGRGRSFPASSLPFSPRAKNALCRAIQLTMTPPVTSQRLLYSVLELACDGDGTSFLLARLDISIEDMRTVLLTLEPPECWPADSPPSLLKEKDMNKSLIVCMLLLGLAVVASQAQTKDASSKEPAEAREATLFSYRGQYKMSPLPTLHSDSTTIRIMRVELLGAGDKATTKITYAPHYGKIDSDSLQFRTRHETQSVSFLLNGDHTKKVKEGDLLRTCFYAN